MTDKETARTLIEELGKRGYGIHRGKFEAVRDAALRALEEDDDFWDVIRAHHPELILMILDAVVLDAVLERVKYDEETN